MGLSKVKSTKQKKRLEARIRDWERTVKSVPDPNAYKKPGSNKK